MQESGETRRVRILVRVGLGWAALIVLRLVQLQVFQHDELLQAARQQQEQQLEVKVPRGTIRDRMGNTLAKSIAVDSVCVNPLRIPDPDVAARMIAGVLEIDPVVLRDRILAAAAERRGFLWVQRRITREQSQRLRSLNLEWIEFRTDRKRDYPSGQLASHIVGSVDFKEDGDSGIELALNDDLQGESGKVRLVTDVKRRAYQSETEMKAIPAMDITLTIDSRIQFVAERELAAAALKSHAHSGSVVCINARTGEILALANWPSFDPNELARGPEPMAGRNDVAITTPYEPGSVFKVITLSAALETTSLRPESMINCNHGVLRLGSRVIHESHGGFGALSMADVLAHSSNIGAIQIAMRMGQDKQYEYVKRFGFGRPTGLPLPSETSGVLRRLDRWGKTSFASVAIGHEISVTAVQLAQACSIVANGGMLIRPRLVAMKQRPGEAPEFEPQAKPVQVLRPETANTMRLMMEGVILHGTGRAARLKGYTAGGKTGTAQIFDFATRTYSHHYNGSFMGFAPVTNPAIAMVVTLNGTSGGTAGFGGAIAAPVWREVATAALRILDVPKDLPDELEDIHKNEPIDVNDLSIAGLDTDPGPELVSSIPSSLAHESNPLGQALFVGPAVPPSAVVGPRVPDFQGKTMRAVIQQAAAEGVMLEMMGHGVARAQSPRPGSILPAGDRVWVQFAR
jgi:cell division protein FtsI (penicillin-binding protein 3)